MFKKQKEVKIGRLWFRAELIFKQGEKFKKDITFVTSDDKESALKDLRKSVGKDHMVRVQEITYEDLLKEVM